MAKFIHFTTAQASPKYQEIRDEAIRQLIKHARFSKLAVLHSTGHYDVGDSINWEYVVRMIEDAHELKLIGVIELFFKRKDKDGNPVSDLIDTVPERFIAGMAGAKRTAGFVSVDKRNDKIVLCKLANQEKTVTGGLEPIKKTLAGIEQYRPGQVTAPRYTPARLAVGGK